MNEQKQPSGKVTPITTNASALRFQTREETSVARLTGLKGDLAAWAVKYPQFRSELIRNPRAMVEKELGTRLPEGLEVRILEEDEDTLYLVIPHNPMASMMPAGELEAQTGITLLDLATWATGGELSLGARLIARAWQDQPFRRRLLDEPERALHQEGVAVPEGVELQVVEDSAGCLYVTLPAANDEFEALRCEIAEKDLETLAPAMVAGSPPMSFLC